MVPDGHLLKYNLWLKAFLLHGDKPILSMRRNPNMQPLLISQSGVHQYDGHVVLQEWASGPGSKSEQRQSFYADIYGSESRYKEDVYAVQAIMKYFKPNKVLSLILSSESGWLLHKFLFVITVARRDPLLSRRETKMIEWQELKLGMCINLAQIWSDTRLIQISLEWHETLIKPAVSWIWCFYLFMN